LIVNPLKTKFRNASGTRITKSLFFETSEDKALVVYTLKREDHLGFPSLYRLYIETADLAEHRFASEHLDGWEHWEMLCNASWFKPYVAVWRRELEAKIESEALDRMAELAKTSRKEAFSANKYLLDRARKAAGAFKRGRPTKVAIEEETRRMASAERMAAEDLSRLKELN
jgi:hypothetical protein